MTNILVYTDILKKANTISDFVESSAIPNEIVLCDQGYVTNSCKAHELSPKRRVQVMDILRDNMKEMYVKADWGWNEVEKRKEVFHKMSRIVTLSPVSNPLEVSAFVSFRFLWDDDDEPEYPVLYCYELQVHRNMQKKGAGLALMRMLQQIAMCTEMKKVSLTVFKSNAAAMAFYKKAGFIIDSSSPSQFGEMDECYEILSDRNITK